MTIAAIKRIESQWYLPSYEEGKDSPSRFQFRTPTGAEMTQISDHFEYTEGGNFKLLSSGIDKCLKICLTGWEHVVDGDGKELEFATKHLDYLPFWVRRDVAHHIVTKAYLSELEIKN